MRYELYLKVSSDNKSEYLFIKKHGNFNLIMNYIDESPPDKCSKYIIIDNETPKPVNHYQLGLSYPPSREEHYKIIFECKYAKNLQKHVHHVSFTFLMEKTSLNQVLYSAKNETNKYFKRYDSM